MVVKLMGFGDGMFGWREVLCWQPNPFQCQKEKDSN